MEKYKEDCRLIPFSSDECPNSADDSDEDVITDYLGQSEGSGSPMTHKHGGPGPLVPTISVTPHSPGSKHYPVLEDNLLQLHEIHESIQQMRDQTLQALNNQILGLTHYARLSTSCPSLNEEGGSDPDLLGSLNSSPTQGSFISPMYGNNFHGKGNSKEWIINDNGVPRRRSWTALEDLTCAGDKAKSDHHQRSQSLSSLDSEQDDPFLDQGDSAGSSGLLVTEPGCLTSQSNSRRAARGTGNASTHSLNEADLQNDFNKIVAKREAESLRLLPARLPLQKSISTPSIIAARDIGNEGAINGAEAPVPAETGSETEEEMLSQIKHLVPSNIQMRISEYLAESTYDHHSKKRRSIFSRKKKDKNKKVPHQWVSACYGSAHACDWCSKPLTNKPALYCENCATTVHQNACKDQIVGCNKPKNLKNVPKASTTLPAISATVKLPSNKRSSSTLPSHAQISSGNSQIINEEKDGDNGHHDNSNTSEDLHFEFLLEGPLTASDLDTDPFLGLHEEEPDSWTPTVGKEITKKLKEKEIKRQEHIYEFILTEKHHCLTLRVMQKVFVEGLSKHFNLGKDLERMFPRLLDLTDIHLNFLQRLRQRQRSSPVVETLTDILLEQFSGTGSTRLKSAYGEFCSRHRDAVEIYKHYLNDRRFAEFVRHCQANPLLKKKGIPECILFVTQRLTKYPLLIEPLIKTSKDNKEEQEQLSKALALVKDILVEVDAQVAEKEKEDRKLEIYNRIDAKSSITHLGNKFKKSDILSKNRRLRFEGIAMTIPVRGKMQLVLVIVLSDIIFFLQENNHKYSFVLPDNRPGVVSLQKCLVREIAGDERGIYIISSNPPEMYGLRVHKPKDKQVWIKAIRDAEQCCQQDEDEIVVLSSEERQKILEAKNQIVGMLRQKDVELAQILEEKMLLQQKFLAVAGMENVLEPPNYCNLVTEETDSNMIWQEALSAVKELNFFASSLYATGTNLSRSVSSVGEHHSEAYVSPTLPKRAETFGGFDNANKEQLPVGSSKGVVKKHSAKDEQSNCSSPPANNLVEALKGNDVKNPRISMSQVPWKNAVMTTIPPVVLPSNICDGDVPTLLMLGQEQQIAAAQLSHYAYKLSSIMSQQMTYMHSLEAQLSTCKSQMNQDDSRDRKPLYQHNQQLEKLRNLQDKFTQEKEAWQREKDTEEKYIEEKRAELLRLQEQVRSEQNDITQQREQLYRKLEMLTSQGILISPNMPLVPGIHHSEDTPSPGDDHSSSPTAKDGRNPSPPVGDAHRKAESKWKPIIGKPALPPNLVSATNEQKVAQNLQVIQKIPHKLSSGGGTSTGTSSKGVIQQILPHKLSQGSEPRRSSSNSSSYHRLSSGSFSPPGGGKPDEISAAPLTNHTRTGSSPAMMQNVSPPGTTATNNKAGRTNTYPKLPERYRVRGADAGSATSPQQQTSEEEVIYF